MSKSQNMWTWWCMPIFPALQPLKQDPKSKKKKKCQVHPCSQGLVVKTTTLMRNYTALPWGIMAAVTKDGCSHVKFSPYSKTLQVSWDEAELRLNVQVVFLPSFLPCLVSFCNMHCHLILALSGPSFFKHKRKQFFSCLTFPQLPLSFLSYAGKSLSLSYLLSCRREY
jgi:hypothetical protein